MIDQISRVGDELNSSEYLEQINEFYSDIARIRIYSITIEKIYDENWEIDRLEVSLNIGNNGTNIYEFDMWVLDNVEILKREIIICHLKGIIDQLDRKVFELYRENS